MRLFTQISAGKLATGLISVVALICAAALIGGGAAEASPAVASLAVLPVNYDFTTAFAATALFPGTPPPGANDFSCRPSAAHPYPVVLVHGTFENMNDNWQAASAVLVNHGYCVFAFNYGGSTASDPVQGTGHIPASAHQLATFVAAVLHATGAAKVDIVGHSQGGMMPRYYIDFLGGAAKVNALVGLAPSNYGTTIDGVTTLARTLSLLGVLKTVLNVDCPACTQQLAGSRFLAHLNSGGGTSPDVRYTVIESKDDEVVTPYTNAFLTGPDVTNITLQQQCPLDQTDHLEIAYDPVALADMLNALDPAHPVTVPCVLVLPLTGPVGPVPPF